jgi:hypothetical protein
MGLPLRDVTLRSRTHFYDVRPWFMDRAARGWLPSQSPILGKSKGIREDIMNGYLPYRETNPAARIGGIRGWQADILRGES